MFESNLYLLKKPIKVHTMRPFLLLIIIFITASLSSKKKKKQNEHDHWTLERPMEKISGFLCRLGRFGISSGAKGYPLLYWQEVPTRQSQYPTLKQVMLPSSNQCPMISVLT